MLAGCGGPVTEAPPAATAEAPAETTSPVPVPVEAPPEGAAAGAAAHGTPEELVRAVYEALQSEDTDAYLRLVPGSAEDFQALAALRRPPPPPPSEEEIAARRAAAESRFLAFVQELRGRGWDPRDSRLVEARVDRATVEGDRGFAEDLTAVIESGGTTIDVTIDDCLLSPRGWLIIDGLRLRD
jgi:hypothetical protein